MITRVPSRRAAGFSLIEVLIAVVVLSFGLLALAALQGSLFKASAEAKMQSVALGLATEKLEYFRGYQGEPDYLAIDTESTAETIAVGGISYTREWIVSRYASPKAGGEFKSEANTATDMSAYADNNEFKRIEVTVNWTDAQGKSQYVTLEDAIAAIDPGDSRRIAQNSGGARPRGPAVPIYLPTMQQDGVIPIALGDGTETAATNPKPIVNSTNVVETRFDILTYADSGDGETANSQSRIQTLVVGCTCDYGAKPTATTARGKRPTYWDGTRYVVPEDTDYVPLAGAATSASSTQSAACTVCCRDHHDPSTLKTEAARFDPRNSSHSAGHFLLNGTTLTGPLTAGTYTEVCRVIRVGGFFRVAADTYNDYMNLLDTNSLVVSPLIPDAGKPAFVPHSGATDNYQDFVKAYLNARVVAPTSETAYNTVLATKVAPTSTLETKHSINPIAGSISVQDDITLKPSDPEKWLHLRGLYVDYLEPSALQAITDAKTRCPDSAQKENCVLRVLPFTSINLTELGVWTPKEAPASVVVASNNFGTTLGKVEPVRGRVERIAKTTADELVNAVATLRRSNSGLTTLGKGIDTTDDSASTPETWTATQPFVVQGGTDDTDGELFKVKLGGSYLFATTNKVYINSSPKATCNAATAADADTSLGSPPNPYTCSSGTLGSLAHTLTVGQYNYQLPDGSSTAALTCKDVTPAPNTGADKTYTPSGTESYPTKTCRNYAVTGVANGVVPIATWSVDSDGTLKEATTINMGIISKDDKITISFGLPVDTVQTPVCTYVPNPDGDDTTADDLFTVAVPNCP